MREISDHWTQKAKKEGYPARSVYKLREIQEKFGPLPREGRILDLGASPGSWSLYVLRTGGGRRSVAAIDLAPLTIGTPENLVFFQGDMLSPEAAAFLAAHAPYDALISDAAPATSGNRAIDTARSEALVEQAIDFARRYLKPGGSCVAKIFQGGGQQKILADMKKIFASVKAFKPKATRSESFEIYLIGQNKKETDETP
jgi:23S rRNA (uridine2552-2'-O)-methyltransferase